MNDDLRKKIEAAYATFPQQVNDGVRLTKKELLNIIEHQEKPNLVRRGDRVLLEGEVWTFNGPDLAPDCEPYVCVSQKFKNRAATFSMLTTPDGRPVDGFKETMIELSDEKIRDLCAYLRYQDAYIDRDQEPDVRAWCNKLLKKANE